MSWKLPLVTEKMAEIGYKSFLFNKLIFNY